MHITIERDGCISCGLCEGTCPSVFRIAEDGLAEVHHQPETAEEQAGAQEFESLPEGPAHIPQIGAFFSQECSVFSVPETLQ